jgi:hypothetical protein
MKGKLYKTRLHPNSQTDRKVRRRIDMGEDCPDYNLAIHHNFMKTEISSLIVANPRIKSLTQVQGH